MTRAIVLGAGKGTRMGDITEDLPKVLLRISGKSILEHQVDAFRSKNIDDINVVTGYMAEKVMSVCKRLGCRVYINEEFGSTGMLETLWQANEKLEGETVICYGDVMISEDFLDKIMKAEGDFCVAVDIDREDVHRDFEKVSEDSGENVKAPTKVGVERGIVSKISKKLSEDEANGEYVGVFKCSSKGTAILKEKIKFLRASGKIKQCPTFSPLFTLMMSEGQTFSAVPVSGSSYAEVDYPKDLEVARCKFQKE